MKGCMNTENGRLDQQRGGGGSDPRLVCIVYVFGLKLFVFSLGWTNGALPVGITDQLLLQVLFDDSPDILQKSDKGQIF